MNPALYQKLFSEAIAGEMQCAGRLANITHYLLQTSKLDGAMVEFGCSAGRTAALMACVCPEKDLWLYDSFQGLPKPTENDSGQFGEGIMKAEASDVLKLFAENKLSDPHLIRGFFSELEVRYIPEKIAFAHLDCDLYESTLDALCFVVPHMVEGGAIILDDYGWSVTPGVKLACEHFGMANPPIVLEISNSNSGQAVILIKSPRGKPEMLTEEVRSEAVESAKRLKAQVVANIDIVANEMLARKWYRRYWRWLKNWARPFVMRERVREKPEGERT